MSAKSDATAGMLITPRVGDLVRYVDGPDGPLLRVHMVRQHGGAVPALTLVDDRGTMHSADFDDVVVAVRWSTWSEP